MMRTELDMNVEGYYKVTSVDETKIRYVDSVKDM